LARVRGIDLAWLLFLGGLAAAGMTRSEHSIWEFLALLALGAIQMAESQVEPSAETGKAAVAIATKLILCCLLVWQTGGIESSYYLIFLLPVVSAASRYGLGGTIAITVLSSGLYLSFLLGVDYAAYYIDAGGWRELAVRTLFLFLSAVLANRLMTENRLKTERLTQAYRELSEAQAEVRRSERLAALGQLSAGLAHEIRNPLGVISASAELLDKHVAQDNKVAREVSGFIRSEVNRANLLVSRFLDFARPSPLQRETSDLNAVVSRAVKQLLEGTKDKQPRAEVRTTLADIPKFLFDAPLIESSVFNLLLNGYEAMPSGGVLQVRTSRNGAMAEIEVSDSGVGIPPEQLESVFNPFFTTKPRGVGLGLAMVSKFIDSHGGKITVASRAGEGSTFRIYLPMETASEEEDSDRRRRNENAAGARAAAAERRV
jgi:two-component system, NtrC family, sensor histidine kinase HydH